MRFFVPFVVVLCGCCCCVPIESRSLRLCECEPGKYFRIKGVHDHIFKCSRERLDSWQTCVDAGERCHNTRHILPSACANEIVDIDRIFPRTFAIVDDPNNIFRYYDGSFWDFFPDWEVWPRRELKRILSAAKPGSFFLDIGSWIGPYTLEALSSSSHIHVRALEPDPRANAAWTANVAANPTFAERAEISQLCIDPTREKAVMSSTTLGNSKTKISPDGAVSFEVPCVRLDKWLLSHALVSVALIKIDIEGHELRSIAHAPRRISDALKELGEPPLMIEVHPEFFEQPKKREIEALALVLTYGRRGDCSFFTREGPVRLDYHGLMSALAGQSVGVFQLLCVRNGDT